MLLYWQNPNADCNRTWGYFCSQIWGGIWVIFRDYKEYRWEYIIIKEMKQVWITLGKNTILSSNAIIFLSWVLTKIYWVLVNLFPFLGSRSHLISTLFLNFVCFLVSHPGASPVLHCWLADNGWSFMNDISRGILL